MAKKKSIVDRVGPWTDIKHDILKRYAEKYAIIFKHQPHLKCGYIEGFAGSGLVERDSTGKLDLGSALLALSLSPGFDEYHLIELDSKKSARLKNEIQRHCQFQLSKTHIYEGDCNEVLIKEVFPLFSRHNKKRGFCLLDPYGLDLGWQVIKEAGNAGTIEVMINFPAMDIEMNAFRKDRTQVDPKQAARFSRLWGDESWMNIAWKTESNLFGEPEKTSMRILVDAFCQRLTQVAGFKFVATPGKFKNSKGGVLYYMVFATNNQTGYKIGEYVMKKFAQ